MPKVGPPLGEPPGHQQVEEVDDSGEKLVYWFSIEKCSPNVIETSSGAQIYFFS